MWERLRTIVTSPELAMAVFVVSVSLLSAIRLMQFFVLRNAQISH